MRLVELENKKALLKEELLALLDLKVSIENKRHKAKADYQLGNDISKEWVARLKSKLNFTKRDITIKQNQISSVNYEIKEMNKHSQAQRDSNLIRIIKDMLQKEIGLEKTENIFNKAYDKINLQHENIQ